MINYDIYIEDEYSNKTIDTEKYIKIAETIFDFYMTCPEISEKCCLTGQEYDLISFDFLFCNGEKTHEINRDYRNKDYPADIITFALFADSPPEERLIGNSEINLGEIIIGLDRAEVEAQKKNVSKETELIFLISHGILHLLGFDHQTEEEFRFVVTEQEKALKSMGIEYVKIQETE